MKFSVILPSYLASYPSAGHNREAKLIRAVNSVIAQTLTDWELIVIADGCNKTVELLKDIEDKRVGIHKIHHTKLWSGRPRNAGIELAKGEWIIYLDNDDIYGEHHLAMVSDHLNGEDWVWYNDIRYKPHFDYWYDNPCDINRMSEHGTSNICHQVREFWDERGRYAHDYYFIQKLKQHTNYKKIPTPEYYVCHVPGGYDV